MSQKLNLPIMVEHDLHEWIVDTTFSTTDPEVLAELCREHDACNGIYPNGEGKVWESTDIVRRRVLNCLKKEAGLMSERATTNRNLKTPRYRSARLKKRRQSWMRRDISG